METIYASIKNASVIIQNNFIGSAFGREKNNSPTLYVYLLLTNYQIKMLSFLRTVMCMALLLPFIHVKSEPYPTVPGFRIYRDSNGVKWYFTVSEGKAQIITFYPEEDVEVLNIPALVTSNANSPANAHNQAILDNQSYPVASISNEAASRDEINGGIYGRFKTIVFPKADIAIHDHFFTTVGAESVNMSEWPGTHINKMFKPHTTGEGNDETIDKTFPINPGRIDNVILGTSITSMEKGAFALSSVANVDLKNTRLTSLPEEAFKSSVLETINLPSNISEIGKYCFYKSSLKKIDLSNSSITVLPEYAFSTCAFLTEFVAPKQLTTIGRNALAGLSQLKVLDLRNTQLTTIEQTGCEGLSVLTDIYFPKTLTTLGTSAFQYAGLRTMDLSNTNVTEIGDLAFHYCAGMESLVFNDKLTKVGNSAFKNCFNLKSLTFPESMNDAGEFGSMAFEGCKQMEWIEFKSTTSPRFASNTFAKCPNEMIIYTPIDCNTSYKKKLIEQNTILGTTNKPAYPQLRERLTISPHYDGVKTYYLENENFQVPAGTKAYIVTGRKTDGNGTNYAEAKEFGQGLLIPAKTGFFLIGNPQEYTYAAAVDKTPGSKDAGTEGENTDGNLMVGTATDSQVFNATDGGKYYVITRGKDTHPRYGNKIGFFYQGGNEGSRDGSKMTLRAHQAGLYLPAGIALSKKFEIDFFAALENETTGIEKLDASHESSTKKIIYDLHGRRVQNPTKGIYIVNGKKTMF